MINWIKRIFRPSSLPDRTLDHIKKICKILFIDDKGFQVVQILQKAGWENTERISDLTSLDAPKVKESHILFVDIQGVGKSFKDEGLGLVSAIKKKYPYKRVIVYSSESQGDRFHESLSMADARLNKNADPYEFQNLVERYSKEAFSLEECLIRLQNQLRIEYNIKMDVNQIEKMLKQLASTNNFDSSVVSKVFNLQNASNLASIIQLFFIDSGAK